MKNPSSKNDGNFLGVHISFRNTWVPRDEIMGRYPWRNCWGKNSRMFEDVFHEDVYSQELFLDFLDIDQGVLLDSRILRKGGNAGK